MSKPLNYQPRLVLGGFGVESVPFTTWRETIAKDGTVQYSHEVSGNAVVECEDGRMRSIHVEMAIYGKKRHSALGGIVASWAARPSKGATHAQCKLTTLKNGDSAFDGPVTFTESDVVSPNGPVSPEAGLCYVASLTKGKTLEIRNAEIKPKLDRNTGLPVTGKDGTGYFVISHSGGMAVVDRPKLAELDDGEAATVSAEPVSLRAAARPKTAAAPAVTSPDDGEVFAGAV
jgi:hypothetical protein